MSSHLVLAGSTGAGVFAGATMCTVQWLVDTADARVFVLGAVVAAVSALVYVVTLSVERITVEMARPTEDMYQEGWELGHQRGYEEGRRVGRPVVVPLRHTCLRCGNTEDVVRKSADAS